MKVLLRSAVAACTLGAISAFGQQQKTVDGIVINLGLMTAERAVHAEGHRDAHPHDFPSGSQHLLVTLADEKTGRRIGDAEVRVEVRDPKGGRAAKSLAHTSAGGMPDYSELFVFGWSGTYTVNINVTQAKGGKPLKTAFTVRHSL